MTYCFRIFNFHDVVHPTPVKNLKMASTHQSSNNNFHGKEGVLADIANLPYSPDMAPCGFFLFPEFKKMLAGIGYDDEEDIFSVLQGCLKQLSKDGLYHPSEDWVQRCYKCIVQKGGYVKKKITKPCLSRLMYEEVIRKLYFLVKHPSYM